VKVLHLFFITTLFILGGCSYSPPEPIKVEVSSQKIDYLTQIKPILDKRCVTCHSCYNSPCQAKFSSFEGIDRGGSKDKVYLAERLFAQQPSRLFIDAKDTKEWRKKKFFSLTDDTAEEGFNNSIMGHMLHDKKINPEIIGSYAPEYDELSCPSTLEEVSEYFNDKENHGMPYGFPALSEKEYALMMQWLSQGSPGPSELEQKKMTTSPDDIKRQIKSWEDFLNKQDPKHQMTARYLYEHYFLAHLNFNKDPKEFYRLVRSSTPPEEDINEIATIRPYDDPKVKKFYYRIQKIHSTIVHKTHIVVDVSDDGLNRIKRDFIDTPWLEKPHLMSYDEKLSANPFITYAQIPTKVRYNFLLSDSEYFIRTFIRGPVCKGQIALNVIHDHFWVMFQDPKYDLGVVEPEFLKQQAYNLSMPIEAGSSEGVFRVFSDRYRDRYERYHNNKIKKLIKINPSGWPIGAIWKGEDATSVPALTVYRHFDSASVIKGVTGGLPKTMWVIDYAQFERIYYTLVAGFDVYGNVAHQTNIRRYMDFLRLEGEANFILYMPSDKRKEIIASWYIGDDLEEEVHSEEYESENIPTRLHYKSNNPKREFIERLVNTHFLKETNIHFDKINYFKEGEERTVLPENFTTREELVQGVRALTAPGTGFIRNIVDKGVNLAYIHTHMNDGTHYASTIVVNRWHDNVNSLFGEEDTLDSSKDTIDILDETIGSYPNVIFDVNEDDLPDFFDMLINFKENEEYTNKIRKYGISRSNKEFWKHYDWFQERFYKEDPLNAGLYDLNRYYRKPWEKINQE